MKRVLIACLENWDTISELPYILNNGGCTVDVYCSKQSWLIANKYYNKWIECRDDKDIYIQDLITLAQSTETKYDWIIPADEMLLSLLNKNIVSEDIFYKILPLTKIKNREILASKAGLSRLCDLYGIPSPKYFIYHHSNNIDVSSLNLTYPLLLKQDLSWGGGGILFCENDAEFYSNLEKTNKQYDTVIQEFITGKDIGVEALFRKGELIDYNAGEVTTYFTNKFDFTTKRIYFDSKRIEQELANIGSKIGINGFASIQFIYNTNKDIYYLLEVDIRPNIWLASGRFTGHDFSKAVTKFLSPTPIGDLPCIEGKTTEVAHFYRDIIRCVKQKDVKGGGKWLFNYKGYWNFIPTYDLILFKRILNELFVKKVLKSLKLRR
jgi:predicted ATP-grasp superfamily ATP-dependent carboligase